MTSTELPWSLTLDAHQQLRREIIEGRLRPNERLIAADLADRLEISRTPVREALQLLAAEGLVVGAKRGYTVREHSPQEVRQIYEVRAALEGFAARLAAERASDDTLSALVALGAADADLASSARQVLVDMNKRFHEAIIAAAGNDRLAVTNHRNSEHFFNYNVARRYTDAEAAESISGHLKIQDALLRRDGDAADQAAREHVMEALTVLLQKLY
ncbi:GntR family transcriptional regulator [Dactylosporangium sp. NPDC051484]|uniref:GntR family transcriptional regulator n=1 Tax=Dactylosporangium sp. NPDC051484 TaxID=3154942 RepID=UPI00344F18D4